MQHKEWLFCDVKFISRELIKADLVFLFWCGELRGLLEKDLLIEAQFKSFKGEERP